MPEWLGKTIGNVRIEKLLARGGMAEVYLGTHLNLERPVAVKLLHSYIEEEPLLLERFRREAKVVAGLRHPNIVQIFDFDTIDGHPYIVMEYLKGPTLATYLRHLHQRKKRIPSDQVARLLNELSTALDYAHAQGVIHRDIKPGNILLHNKTDDIPLDKPLTNDVEVVITDFGLVRIMNTASQTVSGTVSGTPAYMSPEQARGDQIDHRTDIYSLGIVLYEMLAGRVPFEADSTLTILHMQIHTTPPPITGISAKVQAVIDRALLKNPDDRYQTSGELAIDYSRSIGIIAPAEIIQKPKPVTPVPVEAPTPAKPEPAIKPEPIPKPTRSRAGISTVLFSVIGLTVLAVVGYMIFSLIRQSPPPPTATLPPEIPNTIIPLPSETPGLAPRTNMVPVEAGTYVVGVAIEDGFHVAPQKITLKVFWIDKYQVTNQEYQHYVPEWSFPPGAEKHPVMKITWDQADTYCRSLNKRLPDEAEWEAAGRGPGEDPQLYPWGRSSNADGKTLNLPSDNTYDVGSFDFNRSPFNVNDMLGNVYEWVGQSYGNPAEGKHILHGARYGLINDLAFRAEVAPDDATFSPYAGFRCAANQVSD
jgi:serine/threonine protein kinase